MGEIYIIKNELDKALEYLKKGYEKNSHSAEILNNLGLCFLNMGEIDKAIEFLKASIEEN